MSTRLANLAGRAVLLDSTGARAADLEQASGGRLPADPMAALARWDDVAATAAGLDAAAFILAVDPARLGPCVPRPAKVFAVALNYRQHAEETGAEIPEAPAVFTKFPSCLTGPHAAIEVPSAFVDWEVELVAVIGRGGRHIPASSALDHVAGYCVGQDVSERRVQMAGSRPQFSLGKSYDTFGPIGPAVVGLDAVRAAAADPADLRLWCDVDGERVQDSRTSDLIFPVPELVSYLSGICTLEAGDLIFTGTPSGVGVARRPPRFLQPGNVVVSGIDAVGELRNPVRARA